MPRVLYGILRNIRFKYENDVGNAHLEKHFVLRNKSISESHKCVRHNMLRHINLSVCFIKQRQQVHTPLSREGKQYVQEMNFHFLFCVFSFRLPRDVNSAASIKIMTIFMSIIRRISIVYTQKFLTFMSIYPFLSFTFLYVDLALGLH